MKLRWVWVLAALLLLTACTRPPAPEPALRLVLTPTASPAPAPQNDTAAILLVIAQETEAVNQQDIDLLAKLWLPDAFVTDAMHTDDNNADDKVWQGWEAIRTRYTQEVFPYVSAPISVPRPHDTAPKVEINGQEATVTIPASDGQTPADRWLLQCQGDVWRIAGLTFNLTPAQ